MDTTKLLDEVLKEARIQLLETVRNYNINPQHRAWFIFPDGKILGGFTHKSILKNNFEKDWEVLKDSGEEELDILEAFEQRLIKTGSIKIGQFNDNFYSEVLQFHDNEKSMIQGFVESLIKVVNYDIKSSKITISNMFEKITRTYSFDNISNGCLFKENVAQIGLFWFSKDYTKIIKIEGEREINNADLLKPERIDPIGLHAEYIMERDIPRGRISYENRIFRIWVGEDCLLGDETLIGMVKNNFDLKKIDSSRFKIIRHYHWNTKISN